nr:aldo/keto reductase [Prochlorococcus sp. MIT 1223]
MPVLSLGGMRFQQSWCDLPFEEIDLGNQRLLAKIISFSKSIGMHHIETARHYGSSELQLGLALKKVSDTNRILQTKIPPKDNPHDFEIELELSFQRMQCEKVDLLSIHGINLDEHLFHAIRSGGCLEVARRWQKKGKIGFIGFSSHGTTDLIVQAIKSNQFDYVNLHWYFIRQENDIALQAAKELDLGVFIISPTDKGGHLHTPSNKLIDLCAPLHPIVFNDLFCLRDHRVHTLSVGVSQIEDFNLHIRAISLLDKVNELVPPIENNLNQAAKNSLGSLWLSSCFEGLPTWENTPGKINLPILIWLHNLVEAWGMKGYAKARYGLLGNGSHWFPGSNADSLDNGISEEDLLSVLINSPWSKQIPELLRNLRNQVGGHTQDRLTDA